MLCASAEQLSSSRGKIEKKQNKKKGNADLDDPNAAFCH